MDTEHVIEVANEFQAKHNNDSEVWWYSLFGEADWN